MLGTWSTRSDVSNAELEVAVSRCNSASLRLVALGLRRLIGAQLLAIMCSEPVISNGICPFGDNSILELSPSSSPRSDSPQRSVVIKHPAPYWDRLAIGPPVGQTFPIHPPQQAHEVILRGCNHIVQSHHPCDLQPDKRHKNLLLDSDIEPLPDT